MNKILIMRFLSTLLITLFLTPTVFAEHSHKSKKAEYPASKHAPDNLTKAITFVANRPFDSVDGSIFRDGLIGGDGKAFFKNILGLSDQEIENKQQAAIEFLEQRFGIDVNNPGVIFTGFQIDPTINFKAIMMTGEGKENNPGNGFPILEGGFIAVVVDPSGIDLAGEFAGVHAPAGTMLAAEGTYIIQRGKKYEDIVIRFQSRGPNFPVGTGLIINCELFHPEWGEGLGWAYTELHKLSNGQFVAQARNTLTFPGLGFEETMIEQQN
ncbi:MAG: hypothetical protein H6937_06890 [Burkholderiales bacterium]|nr:hypothetical protein [Burkholderiales bacterium]MDR4516867.1 hypothetical protein [Nitrosomonas sp.]